MVIGVLQVELVIDGAMSLKDKRRVVKSLKDKLHQTFQVSVAEVDFLDEHRRALLGIVKADRETAHCNTVLDKVMNHIQLHPGAYVADQSMEFLAGH